MALSNPEHGCTCNWRDSPKGEVRYLAERDAACPRHGDATHWWAELQAEAAAAERRS